MVDKPNLNNTPDNIIKVDFNEENRKLEYARILSELHPKLPKKWSLIEKDKFLDETLRRFEELTAEKQESILVKLRNKN